MQNSGSDSSAFEDQFTTQDCCSNWSRIDVHQLLAKRKQIAIVWSVEDVLTVRPDLTDEQAYDVLIQVKRNSDAELGVSWDTLNYHAQRLFGEEPNSE